VVLSARFGKAIPLACPQFGIVVVSHIEKKKRGAVSPKNATLVFQVFHKTLRSRRK